MNIINPTSFKKAEIHLGERTISAFVSSLWKVNLLVIREGGHRKLTSSRQLGIICPSPLKCGFVLTGEGSWNRKSMTDKS